MINRKDIVALKQRKLDELRNKSSAALDLVTRTIDSLSNVNEEIDIVVNEINEAKSKLSATEDELMSTKEKNGKIITRFKSLIGEE